MSDEIKHVIFAPGILESASEEERAILLEAQAEMQALLDLGGPKALEQSMQVRSIRFFDNLAAARCCVCKGVLTRDKHFDDEYECNATSACKAYAYIDARSEQGQDAVKKLEAFERAKE